MIDEVRIFPLKQISGDRGAVMHMLRCDSSLFENFGEIYFSVIRKGKIKAWKRHKRMTQNFAVPVGEIELVLFDDRFSSSTKGVVQIVNIGVDHYGLIRIPPMIWYGFSGVSANDALIANCASMPHDPEESEQVDVVSAKIPYVWNVKK